jgi:hypothetical protein
MIVAIEILFRLNPVVIPDSLLNFLPNTSRLIHYLTPEQQARINFYFSPAVVNDQNYAFRYSYRNANGYDNNGFRNRENYAAVDVVALGDSFVEGAGAPVGNTWLNLIEDEHIIKILSIGVGGWSTFQEERAFAEFGRGRQAKIVILAFYWNDIGEIETHMEWGQSNLLWTEYVLGRTASNKSKPLSYLVRNYSFIGNIIIEAKRRMFSRLQSREEWNICCPAYINSPALSKHDADAVGILMGHEPREISFLTTNTPGFQLVVDAIRRIAVMAKNDGSRFLVVYIPFREQVYRPLMNRLSIAEIQQLDSISTKLSESCGKADIEFYDMTGDFRYEANQCVWLYAADGHWNKEGHALAAQMLWKKIAVSLGRQ